MRDSNTMLDDDNQESGPGETLRTVVPAAKGTEDSNDLRPAQGIAVSIGLGLILWAGLYLSIQHFM